MVAGLAAGQSFDESNERCPCHLILGARELLTEGDGLSNLRPELSYPIGYVSRNFELLIRAGLDRDKRSICADPRGIRISTNQAVT